MTEQMGTPGSNADNSINGSKVGGAPKDKACPFCQQAFTSSSLGRHLDLYIKEKNPKPADGIHDVDEIRKMRGGITRRQPRNSTSRREGSTPAGTPGAHDRRSPRAESARGDRSPSVRRDEIGPSNLLNYTGKPRIFVNKASWEATGVMNNIPAARNGGSRSWDGEDGDGGRRMERNRTVSKQLHAKATFEQKQKMIEALDTARAAELALREIMGSIRAAKQRIEGPQIFDYDPLALDFPSLCLHCLHPLPTLHTSTPIPNKQSWSITPPDNPQYEALCAHFNSAFQDYRVSLAIATTAPRDDLSYPPPPQLFFSPDEDPSSIAARAESEASSLETKISSHLHEVFAAWTSLPLSKRGEIWTLELARSVGRKSLEIDNMKKEKDLAQQEIEHLKLQVDQLSRLQQPREFRVAKPDTLPLDRELMGVLGEEGINYKSVGFDLADRNVHLDTLIERAIGRWRHVVKETRGGRGQGGMAGQRSLSGESLPPQSAPQPNINQNTNPVANPILIRNTNNTNATNTMDLNHGMTNGIDEIGSDQDADADADMEEDDSYVEMTDGRAPEAPMAHQQGANFRLSNGTGGNSNNDRQGGSGINSTSGMEDIDCQSVHGYVRIGA